MATVVGTLGIKTLVDTTGFQQGMAKAAAVMSQGARFVNNGLAQAIASGVGRVGSAVASGMGRTLGGAFSALGDYAMRGAMYAVGKAEKYLSKVPGFGAPLSARQQKIALGTAIITMPTPVTIGATIASMGIMKLWNKFAGTPLGAAVEKTMVTVGGHIGSGMGMVRNVLASGASYVGNAASSVMRSVGSGIAAGTARIGGVVSSVGTTIREGFTAAFSAQSLGIALADRMMSAVMSVGRSFLDATIGANAFQERMQISWGVMLRSEEAADQLFQSIQQLAARTPFETRDLVQAANQMLTYGFSVNDVLPMLQTLGDATAGSSLGMTEALNRATLALGQMRGAGRVNAQDMRQLTEVGVGAWDMLANHIGVSQEKIRGMVTAGQVSAATGIEAIMAGMKSRTGGTMDRVSQGFEGKMSTFKDNVSILFSRLGKPIFELAKTLLTKLNAGLTWALANIGTFTAALASAFAAVAGVLEPVITPIVEVFRAIWDVAVMLWPLFEGIAVALLAWNGILLAMSVGMAIYNALVFAAGIAWTVVNAIAAANPIGIIVVVIGAIIGLLRLMGVGWRTIGSIIVAAVVWPVDKVLALIQGFVWLLAKLPGFLGGNIFAGWHQDLGNLRQGLQDFQHDLANTGNAQPAAAVDTRAFANEIMGALDTGRLNPLRDVEESLAAMTGGDLEHAVRILRAMTEARLQEANVPLHRQEMLAGVMDVVRGREREMEIIDQIAQHEATLAREAQAAADAVAKLAEDIAKAAEEAGKTAQTVGMTPAQVKLWEFAQRGATQEQLRTLGASLLWADTLRQAHEIAQRVRTPFQQLGDEMRNLWDVFNQGADAAMAMAGEFGISFEDALAGLGGLSEEQFGLALGGMIDKLDSASADKGPAMWLRGSADAISAINRVNSRAATESPAQRMERVLESSRRLHEAQLEQARQLTQAVRDRPELVAEISALSVGPIR